MDSKVCRQTANRRRYIASLKKHDEPVPPPVEEELEVSGYAPGHLRNRVKVLSKAGFEADHQAGSHIIMRQKEEPHRRATAPRHSELARGTLRGTI
ncbi:MAG: type II toxin-antitoxin system HicA family toxin [Nitrososphaerota archaeon]|jgi:predicted RNA binding protein YcfA (HicA-like mRNA interferase family)|nr:type II toxin-antitoxin system HicA family toxin [Nitrososphaerota archaeon]